MKKILLAVSAMTIVLTGVAFAEAEAPVADPPQASSEQGTEKGMANRQNEVDPSKPDKQQKQVDKTEGKTKSNGVMTQEQKKEWEKIGQPQNRTARINASRKHERVGRHR